MIVYTVLIVLIAIIGVLMAVVILLQSGKGGGMAGIAGGGGGGATQLLGARQAPDILEKATWVFATLFIVLCIGTNFFVDTTETRQSVIQSQGQQLPVAPPTATPPAGQQVPAPSDDAGDSDPQQ